MPWVAHPLRQQRVGGEADRAAKKGRARTVGTASALPIIGTPTRSTGMGHPSHTSSEAKERGAKSESGGDPVDLTHKRRQDRNGREWRAGERLLQVGNQLIAQPA